MTYNALLLSMKPEYAEQIFNGSKTVELRKRRPTIDKEDRVFVYVTSPVQAIVGWFRSEKVLVSSPESLWPMVRGRCGLSAREYRCYFQGASCAVGIFVARTAKRDVPVTLSRIRTTYAGFRPPQGFHYLKSSRSGDSELRALLR